MSDGVLRGESVPLRRCFVAICKHKCSGVDEYLRLFPCLACSQQLPSALLCDGCSTQELLGKEAMMSHQELPAVRLHVGTARAKARNPWVEWSTLCKQSFAVRCLQGGLRCPRVPPGLCAGRSQHAEQVPASLLEPQDAVTSKMSDVVFKNVQML